MLPTKLTPVRAQDLVPVMPLQTPALAQTVALGKLPLLPIRLVKLESAPGPTIAQALVA